MSIISLINDLNQMLLSTAQIRMLIKFFKNIFLLEEFLTNIVLGIRSRTY